MMMIIIIGEKIFRLQERYVFNHEGDLRVNSENHVFCTNDHVFCSKSHVFCTKDHVFCTNNE